MISLIIGIILVCAVLPPAIGSGATGIAVGVVAFAVILVFCAHEDHKNAVAWHNRREYWYKGGPERYRDGE